MSYVPISGKLIDRIRVNIQKMGDVELATYRVAPSPTDASDLANTVLWGRHLPFLSQLPDEWLTAVTPVDVEIVVSHVAPGPAATASSTLVVVAFPASRHVVLPPVAFGSDRWRQSSTPVIRVEALTSPQYAHLPGITELQFEAARAGERAEVEAKWRKVEVEVSKLLRASKSLNEACRIAPSVKLYVPEDIRATLDQVARPMKRATAEERVATVTAGLDIDALSAAAVHGTFLVNQQ